jgi:glucose/arabinose dehydrogenase
VTIAASVDLPGLQLLTDQLSSPVFLTQPPGETDRLFVVEQSGAIRILRNDVLLPRPFLDIAALVSSGEEQGLLSLAFHPDYAQNGYFFVSYTDVDGDTRIVRYEVSATDPDSADPATPLVILPLDQPYSNHNGGLILFGPDGMLYVGLGDGGSGGDPENRAQNLDSLLGKMLRLNVDGATPYVIPDDNPFVGNPAARPEIWASGLRNPWRFSFDRVTGDLFIGDVGQNSYEEIDYLPAGSPGPTNFGWNYREGAHPFAGEPAGRVELIDPVAEYGRDQGITVIGGYVYRGSELPEWQGIYLYGDYGTGLIWGLFRDTGGAWQNSVLFQSGFTITSFGEDESGEIYLVDYPGSLYRLEGN